MKFRLSKFRKGKGPDLAPVKQYLDAEIQHWSQRLVEACAATREKDIQESLEALRKLAPLRLAIQQAQDGAMPAKDRAATPTYWVSSWFLQETFQFLTQTSDEWLCFVTGQELDASTFTLERRVTFKYDRQSPGGVKGNIVSSTEALIQLDEQGHKLLAHFHSHPFTGPEGALPSGTDKDFQERLERGGYPTVGAIFTRDGYLRFFAIGREFQVRIYGKGVESYDGKLFRITTGSPLHLPTA